MLTKLNIKNQKLLERALTHSSYTKNHTDHKSNERLEFFGDSVLKLVFSKYLYERFPEDNEGVLTKYRSRLISDDLLSTIAEEQLQLGRYLKFGSSMSARKVPRSIIGDALEALIGVVYLDGGYEAAEKFILDLWQGYIEQALVDALEIDYKSLLQERLQRDHKEHPVYEIISSSGPDHSKNFVVGVYLGEKLLAQGSGNSKKLAGQMAAKSALDLLVGQGN